MENQKKYDKRQFYRVDDSGKMFMTILLASFLLPLLFSMITNKIAEAQGVKPVEITSSITYSTIYLTCSAVMYVLIFVFYNKINKVSFKAPNLNFKMPWKTYLIIILIGVFSLFGIQYFIGATDNFLKLIGFPVAEGLPLVNPTSFPLYLLAVFVIALLPAITEELLFRGVILHGLRSRFGDVGSILLSGLMFALMHLNLQQFIYPFILGCIMGWLVLRTGSLFSSMLVHFINNFLVVTFAFIENMTGFSLALPNTWWFYLIAFGLLFITFAVIWLIEKYYFKGKSAKVQERTSQKTSIYIYLSIAVSVLMLVVVTIAGFVSSGVASGA